MVFIGATFVFVRREIQAREAAENALANSQPAPPNSEDTTFRIAKTETLQQKLRAAEALHNSLIQTLPFFIFRKDLDGRFVFVNDRFCSHVGLPQDEIIGKTDLDLFNADLAAKYVRDDM